MDVMENEEEKDERDFTLPPPDMSKEAVLAWRSPRLGTINPTDLSNPLWDWLVRSKLDAYNANKRLSGPSSMEVGPMWCFHRFGMSRTPLQDGRVVHVAGEHEDHYDPDFHIYNDVIVTHSNGNVEVYGYPKEVFPPTDFHTATLIEQHIVLIGNLGYPESRQPGVTPVLVLDLTTFEMRSVSTHGEAPGWISQHTAEFIPEAGHIVVRGGELWRDDDKPMRLNVDEWVLDVATWTWSRRTQREWTQWWLIRKDRLRNNLWELRQLAWYESVGWKKERDELRARVIERIGVLPDLSLLDKLYQPWSSIEVLPEEEDSYGIHRIKVDGVEARLDEHDGFGITLLIKGDLATSHRDALLQSMLMDLQLLDGQQWEVMRME